jgi:hypothetical protein
VGRERGGPRRRRRGAASRQRAEPQALRRRRDPASTRPVSRGPGADRGRAGQWGSARPAVPGAVFWPALPAGPLRPDLLGARRGPGPRDPAVRGCPPGVIQRETRILLRAGRGGCLSPRDWFRFPPAWESVDPTLELHVSQRLAARPSPAGVFTWKAAVLVSPTTSPRSCFAPARPRVGCTSPKVRRKGLGRRPPGQ